MTVAFNASANACHESGRVSGSRPVRSPASKSVCGFVDRTRSRFVVPSGCMTGRTDAKPMTLTIAVRYWLTLSGRVGTVRSVLPAGVETSFVMAWAVKKHGGAGNLANLGPRGYSDDGGSGQKFERFEPNTVHYLEPDEDIQSLASNTPNPQYVAFCEMTLRIIASALCIPYEFLLLDFKGGSFSASRAALMTTYRTFSMWQNWLIESFLQRLWNWRIAKAIKRGELPPAPVDKRGYSTWYKVRWTTPRYDWIDPQAEAIGNIYNVALGVDSVSDVVATKGKDVEDVLMQKQKDLITAARRVKETNDAFAALGIDDRAVLENFIQVKVPPGINRAPAPAAEISVDDGEDDET